RALPELRFRGEPVEIAGEVEAARIFGSLAAGEFEIAYEHRLHVVDVAVERLEVRLRSGERQLQLEAGEDGTQIVADAGEHGGALLDLPLDALAHLDEGKARPPNLLRAPRPEIRRHRATLAEAFRRLGELEDRLDLVTQEGNGDHQE